MKKFLFLLILACGLVPVAASAAKSAAKPAAKPAATKAHALKPVKMTAAQIVGKNVAARGGVKAWRAVHTLTLSGRMEAGGKSNTALPFVMKMKRPNFSRLEIVFQGKTAIQAYDGEQGWKVRPFLGRDDVEPFTPAEAKAAKEWQQLDGPLVDYASKGNKVVVLGAEAVEGHQAYKLKVTLKNGDERNVWVDASTFLERKMDGEPRMLDGKLRNVTIYYRDFKKEKGLAMPHVLESVVDGGKAPHKMYIEHVAVNATMDTALFAKPQTAVANASMQQAAPMNQTVPMTK